MTVEDSVASNVKVVVRVRPLTNKEQLESSQYCLSLVCPIRSKSELLGGAGGGFEEDPLFDSVAAETDMLAQMDFGPPHYSDPEYRQVMLGKNHTYSFDKIFSPITQQSHIFTESVLPLIDKFMDGYNATIFAYGQVKKLLDVFNF